MAMHHTATGYDPTAQRTVSGFTWRRIADGVYQATGDCPVCGGAMMRRWELGQYAYVGKGSRGEPGATGEALYTPCLCGRTHAGRPAEDPDGGCGAHLMIELPPDGLPR